MLSYGFYNSKNHDRRYDAVQISSMFDGIIRDGVYSFIGQKFRVRPDQNMTVLVDTGRAWFDHTWTLNDSLLPITISQSELILKRIDAIILEVNQEANVRMNSIKVVKGTPSSSPSRPTLTKTATIHQYPLAYITINPNITAIREADITQMVGTADTPFVVCPLEKIDISAQLARWEDEWTRFFETETETIISERNRWALQWEEYYTAKVAEANGHYDEWKQMLQSYYDTETNAFQVWTGEMETTIENWTNEFKQVNQQFFDNQTETFIEWFERMQGKLDEDAAGNLQQQIDDLYHYYVKDETLYIPNPRINKVIDHTLYLGMNTTS